MLEYGIVVLGRMENPIAKSLDILGIDYEGLMGKKIFTVSEWGETDLSSTKVRKTIREKGSIEGMVHPKVKEYIEKYHLYE